MPTEKRRFKEDVELWWDWDESSSGHKETLFSARLEGDGKGSAVLSIVDSASNVYKGRREENERYSIDVQELIKLIKKHGKKLKQP